MPPVNAVYYPSWHLYKGRTPAQIPLDQVTHIYYAFIRPQPDGSIALLDPKADLSAPVDGHAGCLAALAALRHAHTPGMRILVSVGGGGTEPAFAELAASPERRDRFARAVRAFVDEHHFDGVDIDWEHPTTPAKGADFIALLAALRHWLPEPDYLLTTALPVGTYCLGHVDLARAGGLVDMLNLMGYDFCGPWSAHAGHQSQLRDRPAVPPRPSEHLLAKLGIQQRCGPRQQQQQQREENTGRKPTTAKSCAAGVEYVLAQGFPPEKVVLGVPTYGYAFAGARRPGDGFSRATTIENCHLDETTWAAAQVDEGGIGAAWAVEDGNDNHDDDDDDNNTCSFTSFDVPATVRAKARYVREKHLGGLFYWHVFADCTSEDKSLIRAGKEALEC